MKDINRIRRHAHDAIRRKEANVSPLHTNMVSDCLILCTALDMVCSLLGASPDEWLRKAEKELTK